MLNTPEYIVELWSANGVYVADISDIISTSLRIELALNNIETVEFAIDLVQFEEKCKRIGAIPSAILSPYRTDVKVRRNGIYLAGTQVVQIQGNFNEDSASSIEVKCQGYLNLFKDRYISANYSNLTYAQIAKQIIVDTQAQPNGDFGVVIDNDYASVNQDNSRQRSYDLQNVKDALLKLTSLESDNFDFKFNADRKLNFYNRLGSDLSVELTYPNNISSMSVLRDASTLANKVYGIGSGIGEERLTATYIDDNSAINYGVRERTELFNSVSNQSVLEENTKGTLLNYRSIYELPSLSIIPQLIDLSTINVGDTLLVNLEATSMFNNVNGRYRVTKITINTDVDIKESISLDLVRWS